MRKHSDSLRVNILWSALEVFMKCGYERASMDEVARRAGTTKRTVYGHFTNKEKLFLALFDFVKGIHLGRLKTPEVYARDKTECLVLFCGRFMETLLYEGAIRMLRVYAAEADRFPNQSANFCSAIIIEIELRLAAYLKQAFRLTGPKSAEAAERLLGQVIHPRFIRALFGLDPMIKSFDEAGLSPDFDLKPIRKAVADTLKLYLPQPPAKN